MLRLTTVAVVAFLSLSPPQTPSDDVAALKREIQALKAQQAEMQRDLQTIKSILQGMMARGQAQPPAAAPGEEFTNKTLPIADEPSRGNASAKVTVVEVSDYHCPFCKRQTLQTLPQLVSEYVDTGKVKYVFVDYPIAQLHPDAFKSHEAADCAGDQGKYWQMHDALFAGPPSRDAEALTVQAKTLGLDLPKFTSCLTRGAHAASIRDSIGRMEQLGVGGTPLMLIGLTPTGGAPFKVVKSVYGAQPYPAFKAAIDAVLAQAK